MQRDYSQERYLAAKRTVDDRALNRDVLDALAPELRDATRIVEVGAGIGTMLQRLVEWEHLPAGTDVSYTLVDVDADALAAARKRLPEWAAERGHDIVADSGRDADTTLEVDGSRIHIHTAVADATAFLADVDPDVVIGCAFLDLLRPPAADEFFERLPDGCVCYFPITFDGETVIEPPADPGFDELVVERYHEDMLRRREPGDPHAGRRLLTRAIRDHEPIAAGASDWLVAPGLGDAAVDAYPADEAYFLHHLIETIHGALADDPAIEGATFDAWIDGRHADVDAGRLVYLAHQVDVLLRVGRP